VQRLKQRKQSSTNHATSRTVEVIEVKLLNPFANAFDGEVNWDSLAFGHEWWVRENLIRRDWNSDFAEHEWELSSHCAGQSKDRHVFTPYVISPQTFLYAFPHRGMNRIINTVLVEIFWLTVAAYRWLIVAGIPRNVFATCARTSFVQEKIDVVQPEQIGKLVSLSLRE
jgi:hypothetical protein